LYAAVVVVLALPKPLLGSELVKELATELERLTVASGMGGTTELCCIL
jgi:hypothetical protein